MQRFLNWLGTRLFSDKPEPALRESKPALRVVPQPRVAPRPSQRRPRPLAESTGVESKLIDFDAELGAKIEDGGPGKNVLIRNKYLREETGTHETLKIIDDSAIETGEVAGFDPYNTGQFDRSKNWKARTRE